MHRLWRVAPVTLLAASVWAALGVLLCAPAAADPTQIGAWIGPRLFSADSQLGYIDDAPAHPELQNGMQLGFRVGRPFLPWLVPELELALSPTKTNAIAGAEASSVFWFEPRIQLRFELRPDQRVQPFVVIGGGSPVTLSSSNQTFNNSITGDGYLGGGVRFDTRKGFGLRFDARVAIVPSHPGIDFPLAAEVEVGVGIEFHVGSARRRTAAQLAMGTPPADRDGDGIPDAQDACPDRAEDVDGYEDSDGCPDIDNDLDRVLDIADKCPNVSETYNGVEDEDGCPDIVPPEVDALRGTVEGLIYAEGETVVRDAALPSIRQIAKAMTSNLTIRVVLIGHTDDREATQFSTTVPPEGEAPADLDALSADLSRARAEAVKNALVATGIPASRILVEGKGAEESVADNAKPRGRLANRRVEIKLYVPAR
jgi:outer membrane protein OmpA-like peptidoglycan-associated protein